VSFDVSEEYGTQVVVARGDNRVEASGSNFTLKSLTGAQVTGTPGTAGAAHWTGWNHSGQWKVIVGGAIIASGPLSDAGYRTGAVTTGGVDWSSWTTWPSVQVGSHCTIDAALNMTHVIQYYLPYESGSGATKSAPGVGSGRISRWCFDDEDAQEELPPPTPPNGCIDAYNCEEGSGAQYPSSQSASYTGQAQFDLGDGSDGPSGSTMLTCEYIQWYQRSFIGGVWTAWMAVGEPQYTSCNFG
jgi:hypothetical protein